MLRYDVDCEGRLDRFLGRVAPEYSRTRLAELAASGEVIVDGKPRKPSFRVSPGMLVEFKTPPDRPVHDLAPAEIELEIAFEDDDLMVVNKPRGLATHPAPSLHAPSLVNALLARSGPLSGAGGAFRPGIVHRLDRQTTGLLIVAKNDRAHRNLAQQIANKTAERRYLALVSGRVCGKRFAIEAPIGRDPRHRTRMAVVATGKSAVTHVKPLREVGAFTLVSVRLETGRTHQIRVHLASVGLPVVGDDVYGARGLTEPPLRLHAAFLSFDSPSTGVRVCCWVAPPADFGALAEIKEIDPF